MEFCLSGVRAFWRKKCLAYFILFCDRNNDRLFYWVKFLPGRLAELSTPPIILMRPSVVLFDAAAASHIHIWFDIARENNQASVILVKLKAANKSDQEEKRLVVGSLFH